jgi:peptidyl-prolyl cis-trans isomerase D
MLQRIRDKVTGWIAAVILGVIGIVLTFTLVDLGNSAGATYAAKVNGEPIALETVRGAWQQQQQRLMQAFGGEIPETLIKAQQDAVLDQHIRTQLLTERARDLGYRASDELMLQTISGFSELQVDGKFSRERYESLLRQQGRTVPQFERELRASLEIEQLQNGIAGTAFVTPSEFARRQSLQGEQREVEYAVVAASSFLPTVTVAEADIKAWYDSRMAEYMTEERVDLEYAELKLADIEAAIVVTDDALKAYYEEAKERLTTPERRMARHILITAADGVDEAAAEKTANEVLGKVNAGGDFAALATQYSKDPGSAEKGGDLGWATKGMFVGPFEEALFAMAKGEVRGPIKTQFGYHIIRLEDIDGGQVKSFDEALAELEQDYRREQAQAQFYERSQKLADDAFASLTELSSAAKSVGVEVKKAPGFTRKGGLPFGNEPKVIEAAFKPEALEKGENSALLALGDDHAVVLRVAKHYPSEQLPLEAVRTRIEMALKDRASKEAAAKRGAELLARLQGGAAWSAALSEAKVAPSAKRFISRTEAEIPASIRDAAFDVPRLEVSASTVYRGTETDNGDYAVIALSAVKTGTVENGTPEAVAKLREAAQEVGSEELRGYVADLEGDAEIERNPKAFE